jgi:colanic acid biosynthesis glycosyl transferase WcaI
MAERALRILVLVNHYPPDVNPSGKLMHQLTVGLRALGHTVDVLTTFPHYESFRIEPEYRGRFSVREPVVGGRVTRVWAFASGRKQDMLHRLANYLSFNLAASVAGTFTNRTYDVILANSGSFFTGMTGWLLGRLRRVPFIYNVQDIYPDVPVRAGQLRNKAAIAGLEHIERFMYQRAAHVTVISNEQRSVLLQKGVPETKLSVIPNFVDTEFVRPLPKDNPVSQRLGLHDKFVVAHAGNLGYAYDFNSLLQAAAWLQREAELLFLIVGSGVRQGELEEQIAQRQLTNVRMLPFQPEADLPQLRAAIDVQLSLYAKGAVQSSLPSKIYEIMASGRPAIVSAERATDLCKLVSSIGCGICIEPENASQLCDAIRTLQNDREKGRQQGERGREAAVRMFSKEAAVDTYARLLAHVARH